MEIKFEVKINAGVLYDYMLRHTYSSFAGVFGTLAGALILVAFGMNGHMIYLIAGCVILVYQPASLYLKARQQALNPAFAKPLCYRMTEEGVEVSQGEITEFQKWEDMVKAVSTTKSVILYTSRVNASIFPKYELGDQLPKVIEMISTHMPAKKVNIRL